jgi:FixJ family two-component response regulator
MKTLESRFPRHADAQTALGTLKNGAYHLVQKPFRDAQLLDLIGQVARHKYGAAALKHSSRC